MGVGTLIWEETEDKKLALLIKSCHALKNLSRQVREKREEVNWVYPHPDVIKLEKKWMAARYAWSRADKAYWNDVREK
jgi:hypothetical protein